VKAITWQPRRDWSDRQMAPDGTQASPRIWLGGVQADLTGTDAINEWSKPGLTRTTPIRNACNA